MSLTLSVDPGSRTPLYAQLGAQIKAAIGRGSLKPGERLPTMRAIALAAGIDLNTVQRAYSELERDGFLLTQGSRGTFVANTPPAPDQARRAARTAELAQETVATARIEGLDPADVGGQIIRIATKE